MDLSETGWVGVWSGFTCSGQGPVAGCCECGDEPSGSGAMQLVSLAHSHYFVLCLLGLTDIIKY
jgi:hypothetical protein